MVQTNTWTVNIASNCVITFNIVGQGTATATPASCATTSGCPCGTTSVTITATPSSGWSFLGWGSTPPYLPTNPYTYTITASETIQVNFQQLTPIGYIDTSTVYYSGPFPASSSQTVCYLVVKNVGQPTGTINWEICQTSDNAVLASGNKTGVVYGGTAIVGNVPVTIKNAPGTTWQLGLRVWGQGETKPSTWSATWGAAGESNVFIDLLLIAGLIGIPLYLGLKK